MRSVRLCALFALATAELQGQPYPHFDLHVVPPSPASQVIAGYLQGARNQNQTAGVGHRYFYNPAAHTYYGYDIVIQPVLQSDRYGVNFYDLSIGPLDFTDGPPDALDPTLWKKLPLPALPEAHSIKSNEALENLVAVDPYTGQRLIDSLYMMSAAPPTPTRPATGSGQPFQFLPSKASPVRLAFRGQGVVLPENIAIPAASGTVRQFSAEDAEMSIREARITINDVRLQLTSPSHTIGGSLLWFYVPQHGRYVISLVPRPELGFVRAGEISGGKVSFQIGSERVQLESPTTIPPGTAPYLLYVLSDSAWLPTSEAQRGSLLLGSVSPGELAALSRQ